MEIELCDEFYYKVESGNKDVLTQFNTCKENILRNNENLEMYNGEWIKIKINDFIVHHVKPMETLSQVARQYKIDKENIKIDNKLKDEKLFIGQRLKIFKH